MIFHCLFEQSGTFKNVFKKYGHEAYDYDILDDYEETDCQVDLFTHIEEKYAEITGGFRNKPLCEITIFDNMKPETDFIIAFFPCTHFTDLNELQFKSMSGRSVPKTDLKNIENIIQRSNDRNEMYKLFIKLCFVCQELNIPTIIENPVGLYNRNYLTLYSPFRPSYIEKDRSLFGDIFIKATMFFSISFEMKEQFIMYEQVTGIKSIVDVKSRKERSEITPRYADNFYKRFLEHAINKGDKTETESRCHFCGCERGACNSEICGCTGCCFGDCSQCEEQC